MKKIALALAAVASIVTPVMAHVASAGADTGNSTLHCTNFGDNNRCSATDPDFINYIRIINPDTGELIKRVDLACSDQISRHGFDFPDIEGRDHYRIWIGDCANGSDKYSITIPQQTP